MGLSRREGRARAAANGRSVADLRAWLGGVGEIAREANSGTSTASLVRRIAATACQLLGYQFSLILLADPERERLIVEGGYGLSEEFIARYNAERPVQIGRGPLGEGPSSRAFRSGRPVVVPDVRSEPMFGPWDEAHPALEAPYRAMLAVPLITRDGPIGVLNCYTAEPRVFSAAEAGLVEILADQAAIAFEAAELRARQRATIEGLDRQRELLERSDAIHRHLTRVVLESEGLDGITRALGGLLDCSVLIEDAAAQTLAAFERRRGELAPPGAALRARRSERVEAAEQREVATVDLPDGAAFRTAPVLIGQELVGRLWAGPVAGPPGPLELRALEHGATVAALELLRQRAAQEVEWRLSGDLLGDLLTEPIGDEASLRARAARIGHALDGPLAVVVARPDRWPEVDVEGGGEDGPPQRVLSAVSRSVGRLPGPKPLVARHRELVVVVCRQDAAERAGLRELARRIQQDARRGDRTVSVALGPPAEQLGDLAGAYRIARGALNLAQRAGRRDQVITLDHLDVYGLILQTERPEALERFARDLLLPLEAYDRRRGTGLVASVRAYLEHRFNLGAAAAALFVHPHTLGYRLRRCERLLGLDLRQPESLLRLQLAFMIRDVMQA